MRAQDRRRPAGVTPPDPAQARTPAGQPARRRRSVFVITGLILLVLLFLEIVLPFRVGDPLDEPPVVADVFEIAVALGPAADVEARRGGLHQPIDRRLPLAE